MAGKTYVTKGYSTYTNIPARQGGFDHGPKDLSNQYTVNTAAVERVRAPPASFKHFVGSPSKADLLKEYVHLPTMSTSPKFAPTNYEGSESNYGFNYESSSPRKNQLLQNSHSPKEPNFTSPASAYPSEEANRIHFGPGLIGSAEHIRTGNISGPNKSWQSAGPPATHHPLTTSTNSINEAVGYLEESVYYSPRADPRRRGVLDDLSTRAQPLEPQSRYARPAFVARPNDTSRNFNTGSGMDSHEATRRYRGSRVQ